MDGRSARPGEEARVSLDQAVALRFKHFEEFGEELCANVSTGGMFIRTSRPHPVGAVLEFELRPGDALPAIAGKAQVAWVRRRSERADEPVGMGVRFVEIEDESRRLIAELVAANDAGGPGPVSAQAPLPAPGDEAGAPPDEAATSAGEAAAPAEPPTATGRPAAEAGPAPVVPDPRPVSPPVRGAFAESAGADRRRVPWLLLALALVVVLAAVLWWRPSFVAPPAATPPAEPPAAASAPELAPPPAPAVEKPAQLRAVDDWARAWSDQRVEEYLAAYSPLFVPAGGLDRDTWEKQRRARVLAPRWIEVGLAFVELEEIAPDRSRVRFVQAYESDSYADVVRKVLVLERDEEGWKILEEGIEP